MIENFKLKVFRVVADALNFRRAADELHLTQTCRYGSNQVAGRDARHCTIRSNWEGGVELSIGASHTIAVHFLPKVLSHLVHEWPRLRIHVLSGSSNEVLHSLTTHQVSVGLIEAPAFRPDLKIEVFGEDELTLIVGPDHRWARKTASKAAELIQEPILLREVGSGMRRFVEDYLERNGVLRQQLRTVMDISSTEGIVAAVHVGLGIGFVPCLALEKPFKDGNRSCGPSWGGPIQRQLSIALLNEPEPKGPVGRLLELLISSLMS